MKPETETYTLKRALEMFRSYVQCSLVKTAAVAESRYFIPGTRLKVVVASGAAHTVIDGQRWSCAESQFRDAV